MRAHTPVAMRITRAARPMRTSHLTRLFVLALLALAGLAACSSATGVDERLQQQRLALARARWDAREPAAYRFEVRYDCECLPEQLEWRVVEVRDGVVASIRRLDGTEFTRTWGAPTVEDLFARIEDALASGARRLVVRVSYDSAFGFPRDLFVDMPELPDTRTRIVVRGFAALP